ncbi:hypothetical protein K466DRAFT_591538 [Polyporus arcularius HHB13444]|uniref:C2H2-type domain-containing protein n=1 Tax=Polyporus arcularius HHB13444 TaxID=1314778 RepID=A0A5C3NUM0_9APHY|nr:hypothetical protein K466DRAFT_591538 [Polyporus arcularius HHB13444]
MNRLASNERRQSCLHCGRAFARIRDLETHISSIHEHLPSLAECPFVGCGNRYMRKHDLRVHMRSKHSYEANVELRAESAESEATLELSNAFANLSLPSES